MLEYLTAEGRPFAEHKELLTENLNMYMMSKIFHWCSPDVWRTMDEWDKLIYLNILKGEHKAQDEMKQEQKKTSKRKKNG